MDAVLGALVLEQARCIKSTNHVCFCAPSAFESGFAADRLD